MKILFLLFVLLMGFFAKAGLSKELLVEGYITKITRDDVTIVMKGQDVVVAKKYVPRASLRPGHFVSVKVPR
jgi:hypothetical protein